MVRFDQPCYAIGGAVEYFREHLTLGDYLTQEGQAEMTWFGAGAERLGLRGRCQLTEFECLCSGRHPQSGERLILRDKGEQRRVCFFGQISPPKDVSILHLVGGDERIAGWWREAVAETVHEMEATITTRIRRAGENDDRMTGNMVATIVTHDTNRALDPQLHTHVCVMNLTFDPAEERWKSVQPSGLYQHQAYFREVCYNRLAAAMLAAGYELEPLRKIGFTVKGVSEALRAMFSKRRRQILAEAAASGGFSQDELQAIALRTRAAKTSATAYALRATWRTECGVGLESLQRVIAAADGKVRVSDRVSAAAAVQSAEAHVFERHSVVNLRDLLREALVAGRGDVALDALHRAVHQREQVGELIPSADHLTSRATLEAEKEFLEWAQRYRNTEPRLGSDSIEELNELGAEQRAAVSGLLASRARVVVFQGDAGTGKTRSLKTLVKGIQYAGGNVFACAPSAGATDILRREVTSDAETLQQLLVNETLQRRVQRRVFLVDEAGLVSVQNMRDLCRLAARNENRLVLIGDVKQHSSVEAGDALRALQEFSQVPVFRLTEIRRQKDPTLRKAVAMLARRDAFGAFNAFDRLGIIHEIRPAVRLWTAAAEDYGRTISADKSCLAISPVWSEIHAFTAAVRTHLQAAGLLSKEEHRVRTVHSLNWTQEERRRIRNYQPGDAITFHQCYGAFQQFDTLTVLATERSSVVLRDATGAERRLDVRRARGFDIGLAVELPLAIGDRLLLRANVKSLGIRNGDLGVVEAFASDGSIVLRDGPRLPPWFRQFSHGYATTSHASQGKTVARGILLMGDEGIAAGNLKQAYVSNSRFEESQVIYTSNKTAARDAMMRPADRELALELLLRTTDEEDVPRRRLCMRHRPDHIAAQSAKPA